MALQTLYDVYVDQLKDMYSAEKQLVEALPKMAEAASTPELRQALEEHLKVTRTQQNKLQGILEQLGESAGKKVCKGMEGLIEEGNKIVKEDGSDTARDVALILAAQKVEHYEIASYGGLSAYARVLEFEEAAAVLDEILDQEYDADQLLDDIAEGGVIEGGLNKEAER